jgi:hypothetical protein
MRSRRMQNQVSILLLFLLSSLILNIAIQHLRQHFPKLNKPQEAKKNCQQNCHYLLLFDHNFVDKLTWFSPPPPFLLLHTLHPFRIETRRRRRMQTWMLNCKKRSRPWKNASRPRYRTHVSSSSCILGEDMMRQDENKNVFFVFL